MISVCMIVKNEIKYIEKCLEAVSPYVDEIIVADTGSTDGTLEILEKYNCKVYHFEWCDDYSKARNFSISKATNNWILVIDADEHVIEFDVEKVNKIVKAGYGQIRGFVKNRSFLGEITTIRTVSLPRFFHKKYFTFKRDIHEELVPKFKFNVKDVEVGITVNHFGYLTSTRNEKGKSEKYVEDLKRSLAKKYDPYLVKHLAGSYLNLNRYEDTIIEVDKVINDGNLVNEFYFSEAVVIKIKALCALNKYEEALTMQNYFKYCQNSDDFIFNMAYVFFKNKMYQTTIDSYTYLYYKKDISVSRLEIINGLGTVNFEIGNYEESLKWDEMLGIGDNVKERIAKAKMYLNIL